MRFFGTYLQELICFLCAAAKNRTSLQRFLTAVVMHQTHSSYLATTNSIGEQSRKHAGYETIKVAAAVSTFSLSNINCIYYVLVEIWTCEASLRVAYLRTHTHLFPRQNATHNRIPISECLCV